jgi:hypothetical protein
MKYPIPESVASTKYPQHFPRLRRAALEFIQKMSPRMGEPYRALFETFSGSLCDPDVHSFMLPENGSIIDEATKSKLTLESCRLPFTRCAIEYAIGAAPDRWRPSATVLIVEQPEDGGLISARCAWRETMPGGNYRWHPSPTGFGLTELSTIEVVDRQTVLLDKLVISYVHDALKPATDDALSEAVDNFSHEAAVLAHFVLLCNCDNVVPTRIFAPSDKLVKRAKERGNLPPDEYYVLDCFLGEHQDRRPCGDGEHATPRFHVRRGHIRRLKSGSLTWVKQTTVGDINNGKIDKDYRVRTRTAQPADKKN